MDDMIVDFLLSHYKKRILERWEISCWTKILQWNTGACWKTVHKRNVTLQESKRKILYV